MKRYLLPALLVSTCAVATQAIASDLNDATNTLNTTANSADAKQNGKGNTEGKNDRFTDAERKEYTSYYSKPSKSKNHNKTDGDQGEHHDSKGHDKKYSALPPGLQKKVAQGGSLPPGWQKKVSNGQVFSPELRSYSTHSPYRSPKGTSDYILQDKVIRVMDSTNVILDVLSH
jgi:hypothetical protein